MATLAEIPLWVEKVKNSIHARYKEKLTLTGLSKEAGVHPVHLSREFPKYFGQGFCYYVRKIKIEKAADLLRNKEYSLYEIAFRCGFSDPSHFNRCFRKIKGINPSDYRKMLLNFAA